LSKKASFSAFQLSVNNSNGLEKRELKTKETLGIERGP
jgi:hypothetical protein